MSRMGPMQRVRIVLMVLACLGAVSMLFAEVARDQEDTLALPAAWGLLWLGMGATFSASLRDAPRAAVASGVAAVALVLTLAAAVTYLASGVQWPAVAAAVRLLWPVAPVAMLVGWLTGGPGRVSGSVLGLCGACVLCAALILRLGASAQPSLAAVGVSSALPLVGCAATVLLYREITARVKEAATEAS